MPVAAAVERREKEEAKEDRACESGTDQSLVQSGGTQGGQPSQGGRPAEDEADDDIVLNEPWNLVPFSSPSLLSSGVGGLFLVNV